MMRTPRRIAPVLAALLIAACSKAPDSQGTTQNTATSALQPLAAESADVLRAKLGGGGGSGAEYAAYFDGDQLSRIVEHRHVEQATAGAEYEFKGARLLHYRGTKLTSSGELDLQFDLQGRLQSEAPDVGEEEISAVRGRAQLLRNHALAQRATRLHH